MVINRKVDDFREKPDLRWPMNVSMTAASKWLPTSEGNVCFMLCGDSGMGEDGSV